VRSPLIFKKYEYWNNQRARRENKKMETRTILFVDDEEKVLKSLQRGLLDEPYELYFATSGKEALKILEENEVHIIVTDMRMPEMSGLELLKIVKEKYPKTVRMALSGYAWVSSLLEPINQGEIFKFITKPWKLEEEFKGILKQAVEYYNLRAERDALLEEVKKYQQAGV
jgi:response regulator RpfG family c-di-GMP phosphodiesterase